MEVVFAKDKKTNRFSDKFKNIFKKIKTIRLPHAFYYFLILLLISVGFYFMMLLENGFSLAYGGDYTAQYIPMGYHIWDYYHDWIKTGHFTLFDQELYLGANSFGSNAYYGLFSPFNIIIVLLPRTIVPQSMAITSIIKLACAGFFFAIYMRKAFKVKEAVSYMTGIAYAFAGWGAFYLWYNNYQDILVFFPIVLLGIEKTIQEKKPWILALGTFFLAICNYVLMVPYLICGFLYAMFRFFQTIRTRTVSDNFKVLGLGVAGFAGGLLMGLFVFGPALLATITSPKLDTNSYGDLLKQYLKNKDFKNFFNILFSWDKIGDQHGYVIKERVLYPIFEFFFPATTCRSLPTMEITDWDFDDMAVSLWCYVPVMIFLVPALIQSGKEKKWSHYIGFALILISLFTPFMYFVTMGFTNGYARWTLFIATSLIAYVGIYLDKIPNVARWHIHVGFAFAVIGIVTTWILSYKIEGHVVYWKSGDQFIEVGRKFTHRFIENDVDYTNLVYIIELAYVTAVYLTLFFLYNKKKAFTIVMTSFFALEAAVVGNLVTYGHGWDTGYNNGYAANERFRKVLNNIKKTDKSFFRMYTSIGDGWSTNNSFINGYSSASFFHSLYNFEVNDFTMWTGLRSDTKSVAGSYRGKFMDVDNLLGVKYYVVSKAKSQYDNIEKYNPGGYLANVPLDFEERKDLETNEYKVYENNKLNGFGYAYNYVSNVELSSNRFDITTIRNSIQLAKNAHLKKDDAEEVKNKYGFDIVETNASTTSLKTQYKDTHYKFTQYHMGDISKFYNFAKIPNIPNDFTPETNYNSEDAMKYFAFYTPITDGLPLYTAGTSLYIKAAFSGSKKYNFYFIDKDNKIFMMDAHDDDTTDNTSYMRGFYLKRDVYKIAVCGKYFESYLRDSDIRLYAEAKEDYDQRMADLRANPITDVKYTSDKFTFKTNFDANKCIVSQVAYDAGWKVKAVDNTTKKAIDLKVYNGNGGFVSFVAPKGNYSYTVSYETPYLGITYFVSTVAFIGFFTSMLGYHFYQEKRRIHHLDQLFRE